MGLCSQCADKSCMGYDSRISECEDFKPITNADRIRSMTDEELAMWINDVTTNALSVLALGSNKQTKTIFYWLDWLRKEAESEGKE